MDHTVISSSSRTTGLHRCVMLLLAVPAPAEERASLLKILDRTLLFPIPTPSTWASMTDCYTEWQRGLLGISLYLIEWRARFPGLHRRVSHPLLPPSLIPALQSPDVPLLCSSKVLPFPLHFQRWSVLTLITDSCLTSRSTWYIPTNVPLFVLFFFFPLTALSSDKMWVPLNTICRGLLLIYVCLQWGRGGGNLKYFPIQYGQAPTRGHRSHLGAGVGSWLCGCQPFKCWTMGRWEGSWIMGRCPGISG